MIFLMWLYFSILPSFRSSMWHYRGPMAFFKKNRILKARFLTVPYPLAYMIRRVCIFPSSWSEGEYQWWLIFGILKWITKAHTFDNDWALDCTPRDTVGLTQDAQQSWNGIICCPISSQFLCILLIWFRHSKNGPSPRTRVEPPCTELNGKPIEKYSCKNSICLCWDHKFGESVSTGYTSQICHVWLRTASCSCSSEKAQL